MFLTALGIFVSLIAFAGVSSAKGQALTVLTQYVKRPSGCVTSNAYVVMFEPSRGVGKSRCQELGTLNYDEKEDYSIDGFNMLHYLRNNMKLAGSGLKFYIVESHEFSGKILRTYAYRADMVASSSVEAICEVSPTRKTYRVPGTDVLVQHHFEPEDLSCSKSYLWRGEYYLNKTGLPRHESRAFEVTL